MNLRDVLSIISYYRRIVLSVFVCCAIIAIVSAHAAHDVYTAQASVLMVAEPPGQENKAVTENPTKPILTADLPFLATTPAVLTAMTRRIYGDDNSKNVQAVKRHIKARLAGNSSVLVLAYSDNDEKRAIEEANWLADEVVSFYRTTATKRFSDLIDSLQQQLNDRRKQLQETDRAISQLTASAPNAVNSNDTTPTYQDRYIRLSNLRDDAQTDLAVNERALNAANEKVRDSLPAARHNIAENDSAYKAARDAYAQTLGKLRNAESIYNRSFPGHVELEHTLRVQRNQLSQQEKRIASLPVGADLTYFHTLSDYRAAQSAVDGDKAKIDDIASQLSTLHSKMQTDSQSRERFNDLTRIHGASQTAFELLNTRLTTAIADKAAAASVGSVTILDRAVSAQANTLHSPIVLGIIGILISLGIAIACALIAHKRQPRYVSISTIEETFDAPVLAKF